MTRHLTIIVFFAATFKQGLFPWKELTGVVSVVRSKRRPELSSSHLDVGSILTSIKEPHQSWVMTFTPSLFCHVLVGGATGVAFRHSASIHESGLRLHLRDLYDKCETGQSEETSRTPVLALSYATPPAVNCKVR